MDQFLKINNQTFDFDNRTYIMGVLNVTPDSFSDGGRFNTVEAAVNQALALQDQGADILDIGGESTRPGSEPLSVDDELERVIPVLKALRDKIEIPISIDSYKPEVIDEAVKNGASIINDITGMQDTDVRRIAVQKQLPVIIMHMQGAPTNMQEKPEYDDVVKEISAFLNKQASLLIEEGLAADKIMVDPGIGFGKTLGHNLQIINRLAEIKKLGYPVVFGASRKSFIGAISEADASNRLPGTIAANVIAVINGASVIRVHDVLEAKQSMQVVDAILTENG